MLRSSTSRIPTSTVCKRSYAALSVQPPLRGLNPAVREKAERLSSDWKGTNASGENTKNFIGGEFVHSKATQWVDVVDPVRCELCWSSHLASRCCSPHKPSSPVSRRPPIQSSSRQSRLLLRRSRH